MGGHLRSGFLRPSSPSRALIVDERAWRIGAAGACSRRAFLVLKRLSFEVAIDVCQVAGTGATDVAVGQGWGIAALATLQRIARDAAHPTILPPSRGESGSAGVGQPVRLLGVSDAMWSAATPPARELGARGSRRAVASADPAAHLTPTAAAVVAAIPAWWSARARAIGLTGDWLNVERAIDALPPCPVPDWSPLEEEWGPLTGEQVGRAYVDALTPETRARHGRHYTPAVLADELWALGRDALGRHGKPALPLPGLVRDPACGAGALLLPALREHVRGSHGVDPRLVLAGLPRVIEGWDIDPAAVWIANVVLAAELLPLLADVPADRRRPLPALAHIGDGLALGRPPAKVIVMNPPYGRVHLSVEDQRRFADVLYGHANLYGVFMAAAADQVAQRDGVLAALIPTSWTAGRYFAPLRSRLSRGLRLAHVRFVEDRSGVFTAVLQETCLAVFTAKKVRRAQVSSTGDGVVTPVASVATPTGEGVWLLPRRASLASVAAGAAQQPTTLSQLGWKVSTGPLVWNRRKDDLVTHHQPGCARIVWASDFDAGRLSRDPRRDDKRYLRLTRDNDEIVMCLREPAVLVQRTAAPESPRKLVAAHLDANVLAEHDGHVVVENHINVIRNTGSRVPAELLARVLATATLDQVARCISGSVALSAFELEALPMPDETTICGWAALDDMALARAVAHAYHPGTPA